MGASGAAAEHTEPKANVRLPGARNERERRDERRMGASGAAAEHTEPKANVRLPGARNERERQKLSGPAALRRSESRCGRPSDDPVVRLDPRHAIHAA